MTWDRDIDLPRKWGLSKSKHGLVYIVMTDYFEQNNNTIISCAFTKTDDLPSDDSKLKQLAVDELRESFPDLGDPDHIVIGPHHDAYIKSPGSEPLSNKHGGVYNVGTHNGYGDYAFTSLESAVVNAKALVSQLEPGLVDIKESWTFNKLLGIIVMLVLLIVCWFVVTNSNHEKISEPHTSNKQPWTHLRLM